MNITIEKTDRGFRLGKFVDHYRDLCSIQESSLAGEDCIWLGQDEAGGKPARMHLTQEMAAALIPLLQHFVETGELPDA